MSLHIINLCSTIFTKDLPPRSLPYLGIFCNFCEEKDSSLSSFHLGLSAPAERDQTAICCVVTLWLQNPILSPAFYRVCGKEQKKRNILRCHMKEKAVIPLTFLTLHKCFDCILGNLWCWRFLYHNVFGLLDYIFSSSAWFWCKKGELSVFLRVYLFK